MANKKDKDAEKVEINVNVGDYVTAKKFGSFAHNFKGVVEKVYENSVLIVIDSFDPEDAVVVDDLNHRAVSRKTEIKVTKAAATTGTHDLADSKRNNEERNKRVEQEHRAGEVTITHVDPQTLKANPTDSKKSTK
ncbi:hypothetical protein [Levilactobacillus bambusae]|uniref:hypothetical protein n=1 Tax=Levilactobacillus bambusae TaxID=2024736 RepID=UPI001CDAD2D6|nr:hypothetical protein [Levilactobacillus bambusae]